MHHATYRQKFECILFFLFFNKVDNSYVIAMPSRAAVQRATRSKCASFIVKMLMKRLSSKSHQHRILTTNRILPLGSLKRRCVKNIFSGWVSKKFKGNGRVLTRALVEMVLRRLRAKHDLDTRLIYQRFHECSIFSRLRGNGFSQQPCLGLTWTP